MSKERITVENLVDSAIIQGFKNAAPLFMESLEESLRQNVIIRQSGDAQGLLQEMIDGAEETVDQQLSTEHLNELDEKISRILK